MSDRRRKYKSWLHDDESEQPKRTQRRQQQRLRETVETVTEVEELRPDIPPAENEQQSPTHSDDGGARIPTPEPTTSYDVATGNINLENPNSNSSDTLSSSSFETDEEELQIPSPNILEESSDTSDEDRESLDQNDEQEDLFNESKVTVNESKLLILSFVLRHSLSDVATEDLLKLLNCHLPNGEKIKHSSLYLLNKDIPNPIPEEHFHCPKCPVYFGLVESTVRCSGCQVEYNVADLKKNKCYFLYASIEKQLLQILNNDEILKEIKKHKANKSLSSLVNGKCYMRLAGSGLISEDDITIQFNTDGAVAQKSPAISVWPLQLGINELPLKIRTRYTLLSSLWFEKEKPDMNIYFIPFVLEMKRLGTKGLTLKCGKKIRVFCINCPVDTVARAYLQNLKSFRGKNGCSFCTLLGIECVVGRGHSRKYIGIVFEKRTIEQHYNDLQEVLRTNIPVSGIKGPSELMNLPLFDITSSFSVDYLHAFCLGVLKMLFQCFLSDDYKGEPFNICGLRNEINEEFKKITPCSEITRVPQSLDNLSHFKAAEYKNLGIHYIIPLLHGRLPQKYLDLLLLFVFVLKSLLSEYIPKPLLALCRKAAEKFVTGVHDLLGPKFVTLNVHFVLHACDYVEEYGALFDSSTFPYEAFNGFLLSLFHGTVALPEQMFRTFHRAKYLQQMLTSESQWNNSDAEELFRSFVENKKVSMNGKKLSKNITIYGYDKEVQFSVEQKELIRSVLNEEILSGQEIQRLLYDGVLIHTESNTKMHKRNNHTIRLKNNEIFNIINAFSVLVDDEPKIILFGCILKEHPAVLASDAELKISSKSLVNRVQRLRTLHCVQLTSFQNKVVCFPIRHYIYVSDLPNRFERD